MPWENVSDCHDERKVEIRVKGSEKVGVKGGREVKAG
jgi:hypothetical protein